MQLGGQLPETVLKGHELLPLIPTLVTFSQRPWKRAKGTQDLGYKVQEADLGRKVSLGSGPSSGQKPLARSSGPALLPPTIEPASTACLKCSLSSQMCKWFLEQRPRSASKGRELLSPLCSLDHQLPACIALEALCKFPTLSDNYFIPPPLSETP